MKREGGAVSLLVGASSSRGDSTERERQNARRINKKTIIQQRQTKNKDRDRRDKQSKAETTERAQREGERQCLLSP